VKRRRRRTRDRGIALAVLLPLVAALVLLLSSPRHRAFYLGRLVGGSTAGESGPRAGRAGRGLLPVLPRGAAPVQAAVVAAGKPRATVTTADGRIRVPFAEPAPRVPVDGVPPGWEVREFVGKADVELVRGDGGALAVRLRSDASSYLIYRDLVLDPHETPLLSWSWKVSRLPAGGDVRQALTDDEAAQVYVVFPKWPTFTASEVLGYVWDTTAPAGTTLTSPKAPNVRIVVLESGTAKLDTWQREQRNVLDDYRALFGHEPPRIGGVAIMIDSNETRSQADAQVGELSFARTAR
jgi:hypothetical protein